MYEHGDGVPRDPVMARMWLNLAVSRAPSLSRQSNFAMKWLPK
jgi:TPR repeat protein